MEKRILQLHGIVSFVWNSFCRPLLPQKNCGWFNKLMDDIIWFVICWPWYVTQRYKGVSCAMNWEGINGFEASAYGISYAVVISPEEYNS